MFTPGSASYRAQDRRSPGGGGDPSGGADLIPSLDDGLAALELATGQEACERLLSIDGLPPRIEIQTRQRMAELAPALQVVAPAARWRQVAIPLPGGWSLHGGSIAQAADGFRMVVTSANASRHADGSRAIHDAQGIVRGRNYWVDLDPALGVRAVHAIHDDDALRGDPAILAIGVRHVRPFVWNGEWWIVGSIGDPEANQTPVPLLARLDGVRLRDTTILRRNVGPDPRWNPMIGAAADELWFMSDVYPTVVWRAHDNSRAAMVHTQCPAPLIARRLIGGTHVIPADDGFLSLAHERVALAAGGVRTVHRWLWFDASLTLARLSRPCVLRQGGAERAMGLARAGDDLIVSVADERGEIWLGSAPSAQVDSLLAPPLELDLELMERQLAHAPHSRPASKGRPSRRLPTKVKRARRPTIASMTMTGSNRDIVGDALRSVVDWVDWCVLIDTGIDDDTVEIAREVAGDKLVVRDFPWCDDFSAVRNFALAAAADTGATWAVFVDSDERLVLNGVDIHAVLASSPEFTLLVPHDSGEYTKDRFFRLPIIGGFRGPTHEAFYITFDIGGGTVAVPDMVFEELPKSPERLRQKDERDRDMLARHTQATPDEPRWFYYLGDVLARLGQYEDAVAAFRSCFALRGWDEESAWAMYRATQCLIELGRLEEALETIVLGMARHAGLADFAWLASLITHRLGRQQQAVYWANLSIELGYFEGIGPTVLRTGWRYPFALWEGPYDVLRFALKELGDDQGAAEAERHFIQAAAAREAYTRQGVPGTPSLSPSRTTVREGLG